LKPNINENDGWPLYHSLSAPVYAPLWCDRSEEAFAL